MRKIIISTYKNFKKDEELVKKILGKLDKLLKLKNKYVEVYLVKDNFNVHSFPAVKNFPRPDIEPYKNLGEIYINPERGDVVFLVVHGLLHLIGYDHKKKNDRLKMEKKEQELLDSM